MILSLKKMKKKDESLMISINQVNILIINEKIKNYIDNILKNIQDCFNYIEITKETKNFHLDVLALIHYIKQEKSINIYSEVLGDMWDIFSKLTPYFILDNFNDIILLFNNLFTYLVKIYQINKIPKTNFIIITNSYNKINNIIIQHPKMTIYQKSHCILAFMEVLHNMYDLNT